VLKNLLGKDLGICGSDAYLHLLPPHSVKFISMHTILGMIKGIRDLLQPVLSIIQDGNLAKDLNANISLLLKGLLMTNLNTEKNIGACNYFIQSSSTGLENHSKH